MTGLNKKFRYYLSSIVFLIDFLLLVLFMYFDWNNAYNERLINLDKYHAWLIDRVEMDSIRQLIYLYYMVQISFVYWLLEWNKKHRFIIPIITGIATFILYYFAADWWHMRENFDFRDIFVAFPSIVSALIWIWIARAIFVIIKRIKVKIGKKI